LSTELGVAAAGARPVQRFAVGTSSIKGSVEPVLLDGRELVGPNEALLGSDTFDALDVSLGDTIDVSGPLGTRSMVVVGRVMVPVLGADSPDIGVVVPLQTMLDLGGLDTLSEIDVQAALFVSVADGIDAAALGRDIEGYGATLDGPFRPSSVSVLDEVRTIPIFVAAFVALLGSLAMLHALVVSARLRRIELATFRALGALPRDARNAMRWQGSFTAATAVAIGLPLGLVAGQWLWRSIAERNNVVAVVDTPWPVLAVFAAAVVGAALVLAAWPAWNAGRRRPAHDLRAE
jgi:ABC-type lipoprotein release transport system permease subunit